MFAKLTLRLEKSLIEEAKDWADENRTSLSKVVAMVFKSLGKKRTQVSELTPWTRKLMGIAREKGRNPPTDKEMKKAYVDYLEEKYK